MGPMNYDPNPSATRCANIKRVPKTYVCLLIITWAFRSRRLLRGRTTLGRRPARLPTGICESYRAYRLLVSQNDLA